MSKKHAYLIIAHTNFHQLRTLVELLDDVRNDIYVLIDKKANGVCQNELISACHESILRLVPGLNINWGGYSLIKAEMSLFKVARRCGTYEYYHLLSGMDLPLHNQDFIHAFFERYKGYEFFTFVGEKIYERNDPRERISFYYPFQDLSIDATVKKWFLRIQRRLLIPIQKVLKINRLKTCSYKIGYGSNWVSVTDAFVDYMLKQANHISRMYKFSIISDELYKHTLLLNSSFKDRVFIKEGVCDKPEDLQGNLRYINWWDGSPKVWKFEDREELEHAAKRGFLFSRKFNEKVDSQIIEHIRNRVNSEVYKGLYGDFII